MKFFKTINKVINDGTSLTKEYTEYELEHLKLKVFYHLAKISVGVAKKLVLGTVLLLFCFFCSVSLSIYLGTITGSAALGFLITSGIYLVLAMAIYLRRHSIEKYVVEKLSVNYFQP